MQTLKKLGLVFLFLDFMALTVWAAVTGSDAAHLAELTTNPWAIQIFCDLCVAASFGIAWMWQDAKKRGINPLPYAIAVIPTGSIALLVYLLRRELATAPEARERLAAA